MTHTVIVTDGDQRAALAVVRSLGRAGYRCVVCSTSGRSLAGASRFARAEHRTPDPLTDAGDFVTAVAALVRASGAAVVLPVTEPAVLALLAAPEALRPAGLPLPELEVFRRISDKALLLQTAPAAGIAVPKQIALASPAAAATLTPAALRVPVVIKPARSVGEADGRRQQQSVAHAGSWDELHARLRELGPAAYPLLVQERIVGPGIGIFLLRWDGEILAEFAHRRIREKPPAGGVSVYRESVPADPDLVARSRALLERFHWQGVAMVEYKVDAASGTPYLMEVNGRFWGSLQLAVDAGVDFPRLLVEAALGRRPAPVRAYRANVRSRWWWGDVDQLLLRLRRSDAALALPPDAPSRWRALADFLVLWRPGDRNEILRASDPWPFVRETLAWFQGR